MFENMLMGILAVFVIPLVVLIPFGIGYVFVLLVAYIGKLWFGFLRDTFKIIRNTIKGEK